MTTVWSANTVLNLNQVVVPTATRRKDGLFFRVTTAGTTGATEPNWPSTVGQAVYDTNTDSNVTNVQYVSFSSTFSDIQSINPSAVIELFTLTLQNKLHYDAWEANKAYTVGNIVDSASSNAGVVFKCTVAGTSGSSQPSAFGSASIGQIVTDNQVTWTAQSVDIYYFHSGSSLNANNKIKWQNVDYLRFPIQASGFAFQKGQLPRPKLVVSNATGLISSILLTVNQTTTGNDLTGAKVTRIRTLAKFIDAANFADGQNPNADPTAEFPREIYSIDRKSAENREVVEFELAAPTDLAGIRIPKRQCTRKDFPGIGTFSQ